MNRKKPSVVSTQPEASRANSIVEVQQGSQDDSHQELNRLKNQVAGLIKDAREQQTKLNTQETTVTGLIKEMIDHRGLLIYGFMVLLVMVATMIFMVITLFVEVLKDQRPNVQYEVPVLQATSTQDSNLSKRVDSVESNIDIIRYQIGVLLERTEAPN